MRYRQTSFDDGQRAATNDALQALDEIGTLSEINSIREPDHFDTGGVCEEALDGRQRVRAIDGIWLGLELFDLNACGAGDLQGDVPVGLRQRQQRNAAI